MHLAIREIELKADAFIIGIRIPRCFLSTYILAKTIRIFGGFRLTQSSRYFDCQNVVNSCYVSNNSRKRVSVSSSVSASAYNLKMSVMHRNKIENFSI